MYQYGGAEDTDILREILTTRFFEDPAPVVAALTGIETHLRPEFRDETFKHFLYDNSCFYPDALTDVEGGFDFSLHDREMRGRLESIKNSENAEVISYLVENLFSS